MMIMPFHLAGMALPISPALPDLLRSVVRAQQLDLTDLSTLTFNFRSPGYSAETGGVHPVELRLIRWLITSCRSANNIMPITIFLPAGTASFFYSA